MADRLSICALREAMEARNGVLYWAHRERRHFATERAYSVFCSQYAGRPVATWVSKGYLCVSLRGVKLRAHRVVWALSHGRWPDSDIDHINGNRSDNRLENLREATRSENLQNMRQRCDNTSGVTGVRKSRGKWQARIQVKGRMEHLGTFATLAEATKARKDAETLLGFSPRHGCVRVTVES